MQRELEKYFMDPSDPELDRPIAGFDPLTNVNGEPLLDAPKGQDLGEEGVKHTSCRKQTEDTDSEVPVDLVRWSNLDPEKDDPEGWELATLGGADSGPAMDCLSNDTDFNEVELELPERCLEWLQLKHEKDEPEGWEFPHSQERWRSTSSNVARILTLSPASGYRVD